MKGKSINITLPTETLSKIRRISAQKKMTRSVLIDAALQKYLNDQEEFEDRTGNFPEYLSTPIGKDIMRKLRYLRLAHGVTMPDLISGLVASNYYKLKDK